MHPSRRQTNSLWGAYSAQVLATDEAVIPLRTAGYSLNNNGIFLSCHWHQFYPQLYIATGGPWNLYFTIASRSNDVIAAIESDGDVIGTFKLFASHNAEHFDREEELFLDSDYPEKEDHLYRHKDIRKTVNDIAEVYKTKPDAINMR